MEQTPPTPETPTVKIRSPRMRACNQPVANGKLCVGHLKRWYHYGEELERQYGKSAEIYRCEKCHTVYLPNPEEAPRSRTLSY